jgi:hypothetical protein
MKARRTGEPSSALYWDIHRMRGADKSHIFELRAGRAVGGQLPPRWFPR